MVSRPLISSLSWATRWFAAGSTFDSRNMQNAEIPAAKSSAGSAMRYRLTPSALRAVTSFDFDSTLKVISVVTSTRIGAIS